MKLLILAGRKFLDTPVKRYSSGMYVRLAFAVAAHLEPEILIIDEVLSVGDAEFQKMFRQNGRCHKSGRTVLFVSHNMSAVEKLCSKCFLLKQGQFKYSGSSSQTIAKYLNFAESNQHQWTRESTVKKQSLLYIYKSISRKST